MLNNKIENLESIAGVSLSSAAACICYTDRDDVVLIELASSTVTAAVFTKNAFCAAPVSISKMHLEKNPPRYLIINSGNANAGTGEDGFNDAQLICKKLAEKTNCEKSQVLPFSTGVIGKRLEVESFYKVIPELVENLQESSWPKAAQAIMTTDTVPKAVSTSVNIAGSEVKITGICKGAGMIRPDMATLLAFVATDANISQEALQYCLNKVVNKSFNRVTVDGDTSTNDSCLLFATNKAGNNLLSDVKSEEYLQFEQAMTEVCINLAQAIIRDGEGASKFVTINVSGGLNSDECLEVAYTVAHSPLVKTALFASDANWGRILAAIGRAKLEQLDINKVSISLDQIEIISNGAPSPDYTEELGTKVMQQDDISINISLQRGKSKETIWTTDLSHDYVTINAEYRT